jgi:hypothetical protein
MKQFESRERLFIADGYEKVRKTVLPLKNPPENLTRVQIQPPPSCEMIKEHKFIKSPARGCDGYVKEKEEKKESYFEDAAEWIDFMSEILQMAEWVRRSHAVNSYYPPSLLEKFYLHKNVDYKKLGMQLRCKKCRKSVYVCFLFSEKRNEWVATHAQCMFGCAENTWTLTANEFKILDAVMIGYIKKVLAYAPGYGHILIPAPGDEEFSRGLPFAYELIH